LPYPNLACWLNSQRVKPRTCNPAHFAHWRCGVGRLHHIGVNELDSWGICCRRTELVVGRRCSPAAAGATCEAGGQRRRQMSNRRMNTPIGTGARHHIQGGRGILTYTQQGRMARRETPNCFDHILIIRTRGNGKIT
jgi:hypothetical protein